MIRRLISVVVEEEVPSRLVLASFSGQQVANRPTMVLYDPAFPSPVFEPAEASAKESLRRLTEVAERMQDMARNGATLPRVSAPITSDEEFNSRLIALVKSYAPTKDSVATELHHTPAVGDLIQDRFEAARATRSTAWKHYEADYAFLQG